MRPLAASLVVLALAACSPAAPPAPAIKPVIGYANQLLVAAQAHLAGEAPPYAAVAWERRADEGDIAVFDLTPGPAELPPITARVRDGRIVEFMQSGPLSRRSLAALAAAAGAPPGEHGPTAEKVEALIAEAKAKGQEASAAIGTATYAAAPGGDLVKARPAG